MASRLKQELEALYAQGLPGIGAPNPAPAAAGSGWGLPSSIPGIGALPDIHQIGHSLGIADPGSPLAQKGADVAYAALGQPRNAPVLNAAPAAERTGDAAGDREVGGGGGLRPTEAGTSPTISGALFTSKPKDSAANIPVSMFGPHVVGGGGWRKRIAPEAEKAQNAYFSQANDAAKAKTDADTAYTEAEMQGAAGRAGVLEAQRMRAEAAEQKRREILDRHAEEQKQMMDDIRSEKIDPGKIFKGPTGGLTAATAMIGAAFGAYGATMGHTPNFAAEAIEREIDRSIDAQKAELEKKKTLLAQSNTQFGQYMARFGDERTAEAALKSDMLAAAEAHTQVLLGGAKTEQQRANGLQLLANIQGQRADAEEKKYAYVAPQATPDMRGKYVDLVKTYVEKGASVGDAQRMAAATLGVNVPGAEGLSLNTAKKGQKGLPPSVIGQLGSIGSAKQALQDELSLIGNPNISDAEKRRRSKSNLDMLSLELPKAYTGGVPQKEEIEMTRGNLPSQQGGLTGIANTINPWGIDERTRRAQLQHQIEMLNHKEEALRRTANEARTVGSSAEGEADDTPEGFEGSR